MEFESEKERKDIDGCFLLLIICIIGLLFFCGWVDEQKDDILATMYGCQSEIVYGHN